MAIGADLGREYESLAATQAEKSRIAELQAQAERSQPQLISQQRNCGEQSEYITGAKTAKRIPEHAQAFASVLRLAAERIERGESVQDVVRNMALHNVVLALSGLV